MGDTIQASVRVLWQPSRGYGGAPADDRSAMSDLCYRVDRLLWRLIPEAQRAFLEDVDTGVPRGQTLQEADVQGVLESALPKIAIPAERFAEIRAEIQTLELEGLAVPEDDAGPWRFAHAEVPYDSVAAGIYQQDPATGEILCVHRSALLLGDAQIFLRRAADAEIGAQVYVQVQFNLRDQQPAGGAAPRGASR